MRRALGSGLGLVLLGSLAACATYSEDPSVARDAAAADEAPGPDDPAPSLQDGQYVDGLNGEPEVTTDVCFGWYVDGEFECQETDASDEPNVPTATPQPAPPPQPVVPDRVSARMRGPLHEEFLESFTQVLPAVPHDPKSDLDLGGVALMLPYYGGTPIVYTDYGAFRIDLRQELLDGPPPLDTSYTTIGEFSVTGRIGFVDHEYAMVWMPGSTDESGPHRLRISARFAGDLQELLVQAWPAEPSPPQQLKPAPG